jgi:disulfide bond formation protein DsbB
VSEPTIVANPVLGAPRRKPPETLPPELFPLLARNRAMLLFIGWSGIAGSIILFSIAMRQLDPGLPPALQHALISLRFFGATLNAVPAIHLLRYAAAITHALDHPSGDALTLALRQQRRYWRFIGVTIIVYLLAVAVAVAAPQLLQFRDSIGQP